MIGRRRALDPLRSGRQTLAAAVCGRDHGAVEGKTIDLLRFWMVFGTVGLVAAVLAVLLGWGGAALTVLVSMGVVSVLLWTVSTPPASHGS